MVSLIAMLIFNKFSIMLFRLSICRSFNYLVHLSPFLASIMSFKYLDSFLSNKQTDTSPTMPHSTSPMMSVLKIKDPTPSNELNDYNFYHQRLAKTLKIPSPMIQIKPFKFITQKIPFLTLIDSIGTLNTVFLVKYQCCVFV